MYLDPHPVATTATHDPMLRAVGLMVRPLTCACMERTLTRTQVGTGDIEERKALAHLGRVVFERVEALLSHLQSAPTSPLNAHAHRRHAMVPDRPTVRRPRASTPEPSSPPQQGSVRIGVSVSVSEDGTVTEVGRSAPLFRPRASASGGAKGGAKGSPGRGMGSTVNVLPGAGVDVDSLPGTFTFGSHMRVCCPGLPRCSPSRLGNTLNYQSTVCYGATVVAFGTAIYQIILLLALLVVLFLFSSFVLFFFIF
jgi:hypothetical protein